MGKKTYGEICNPSKEASIEWKIHCFSIPYKADSFVDSPTFHGLNASWCLRLYPNGQRKFSTVGYLDLYLYLTKNNSGNETIPVDVILGMIWPNRRTQIRVEHTKIFSENTRCGILNLMSRNMLLECKDEAAPSGVLRLYAILKLSSHGIDASSQTAFVNESLYRDFAKLFYTKEKSDVVIKLKREEFPAHKLILGTRSSVFAAMFKYSMKENTDGILNLEVEDYDPDAFYEFLRFIYTGQIKELSRQNVFQLFMLTDKYDVSGLKDKCLDYIKSHLTLDNALDALALADRHNEAKLKGLAKKLVVDNMKALFPTPKWITFMRENATLVEEVLKDFYSS